MTAQSFSHGPTDDADLLAWLRLIRSQNIGPATFWGLLARFGSAIDALDALPQIANRAGRDGALSITSMRDAERELSLIKKYGARLVPFGHDSYPPLLAMVDAPPPLLTVLGDASVAGPRTVGIVGARNASAAGRKMAAMMSRGLGQHGVTVASGLARGVDTHAHEAALETGTVAVTAGGINIIYPRENTQLHAQIAQTGAVVTEMPFGAEPVARHFPRRNRLISGMSAGVVVIEAAVRSGSLITARFANEQGRDVFAVPGSPLDQRARGTNDLIREGATLVQGPEDVLEALESQFSEPGNLPLFDRYTQQPAALYQTNTRRSGAPTAPITEENTNAVHALLSPSPVELDELIRLSALTAAQVSAIILELEISGRAVRHPGGRISNT